MRNLHQIDLNLLLVFDALMEKRRVQDVADAIGLSQPAVSSALKRLRQTLGDDLFLRSATGMIPTPFAQRIAGPVADALSSLEMTLHQSEVFQPAHSDRTFRIAMSDIGEIYFLPRLLTIMAHLAPNVRLQTLRVVGDALRDGMLTGRIDLALGLLPGLQAGFKQRRLFRQQYVCLMRRGHPLGGGAMDRSAFAGADHVVVQAKGTGHGEIDQIIERAGVSRNIVLQVPHFVAIGHILRSTDMIATVPQKFAESCLAPFDLVAVAHPLPLPETGIYTFWHDRFHRQAANQWLRGVIADEFAEP